MATVQSSCGISVDSLPNIAEFTKNVVINVPEGIVNGEGIFDDLMETATKHLKAQFESNRIRNEDYATAYIQIYQNTLTTAFNIWSQKSLNDAQIKGILEDICIKQKQLDADIDLKQKQLALQEKQINAEVALKEKQLALLEEQIKAEEAKHDLYRRQIEGFDEDYKQKILKICMDSWSVGYSVARDSFEARGIPAPIQKTTIDDLYNDFIVTELDNFRGTNDSTTNKP